MSYYLEQASKCSCGMCIYYKGRVTGVDVDPIECDYCEKLNRPVDRHWGTCLDHFTRAKNWPMTIRIVEPNHRLYGEVMEVFHHELPKGIRFNVLHLNGE